MINLIIAIFGLGIIIWVQGVENNTIPQKIIGSVIVELAFLVNILNVLGVII